MLKRQHGIEENTAANMRGSGHKIDPEELTPDLRSSCVCVLTSREVNKALGKTVKCSPLSFEQDNIFEIIVLQWKEYTVLSP